MSKEELSPQMEQMKKNDEIYLRSKGRAITPEEKRAVIERIMEVWLKFPTLRLGQLLINSLPSKVGNGDIPNEIFYSEDEKLCLLMEKYLKDKDK